MAPKALDRFHGEDDSEAADRGVHRQEERGCGQFHGAKARPSEVEVSIVARDKK